MRPSRIRSRSTRANTEPTTVRVRDRVRVRVDEGCIVCIPPSPPLRREVCTGLIHHTAPSKGVIGCMGFITKSPPLRTEGCTGLIHRVHHTEPSTGLITPRPSTAQRG